MNKKSSCIRTGDIVLTAVLAALSALLLLVMPYLKSTEASHVVEVYCDGALVKTLDISKDGVFEIDRLDFEITVNDGRVWVSNTSCRDKSCTRMKLDGSGGSIICLPNKIVITPRSDKSEFLVAG